MSKSVVYAPVEPRREPTVLNQDLREILGPPPIINGEDPDSYNKLHDQVRSAVAPTDVIEEMWVRDVVDAFWESLRLRRLRAKLFVACEHEGLRLILESMVDADETDKLVYGWLDRNPRNVKQVNKLLAQAGFTHETIVAQTLSARLDEFDRIDRMIAQAETWRNGVLREIDRRREAVSRRLREALDDIQDAEFQDESAHQEVAAE
jgi:hypothetical protein